nr:hypothetical protein [uncultured Lachnoclostridium sp.]
MHCLLQLLGHGQVSYYGVFPNGKMDLVVSVNSDTPTQSTFLPLYYYTIPKSQEEYKWTNENLHPSKNENNTSRIFCPAERPGFLGVRKITLSSQPLENGCMITRQRNRA